MKEREGIWGRKWDGMGVESEWWGLFGVGGGTVCSSFKKTVRKEFIDPPDRWYFFSVSLASVFLAFI